MHITNIAVAIVAPFFERVFLATEGKQMSLRQFKRLLKGDE